MFVRLGVCSINLDIAECILARCECKGLGCMRCDGLPLEPLDAAAGSKLLEEAASISAIMSLPALIRAFNSAAVVGMAPIEVCY